jgi:predicted nucleic acid-binding protein
MTLVLVDTSVWVQHFRVSVPELVPMLQQGEVVKHSVVIGELAVGNLRQRPQTLADLTALGRVSEASSRALSTWLNAASCLASD